MSNWRFVQSVDTLSLRGNRLFGAAGTFGESTFPPRPSVIAGAFRSLLLAQSGMDLNAFARGKRLAEEALDRLLGTPKNPGEFAVRGVFPACKGSDGQIELLMPLPANLVVTDEGNQTQELEPQPLPTGVATGNSTGLPMLATLRQKGGSKPESGWLLSREGIDAYLTGTPIGPQHLVHRSELWGSEARIGIGLSRESHTVESGKLFAVEHTVARQQEHGGPAAGLAVRIGGGQTGIPERGFLRVGGDGRAASCAGMAEPDLPLPLDAIADSRRFKLVLTTPGLFSPHMPRTDGQPATGMPAWFPPLPASLQARLACAAVPRFEVISGWDLAAWAPKTAERAVPAGAVYWFDEFNGDPGKLADWVASGLWSHNPDTARRAEGFNNALLAAWPQS
jgi:CRISPR-associated protein Cmr3